MVRSTQRSKAPEPSPPVPSVKVKGADLPAQQESQPATLGGPSEVPPHPPTEIIQIPEIPDVVREPFPYAEVSVDKNGIIQIK